MKPRITFSIAANGTLEMYFNEAGRQKFIQELSRLNEQHEHFHFAPADNESQLDVSTRPYHSQDRVLEFGKVLFRTDDWDKKHYPHVMDDAS